jgi:DNA-binding CsgD family transcriptional regulator
VREPTATVADRAYSLEGGDAEWLAAVVRAVASVLDRGVVGSLVERRPDGRLAAAHVALEGVAERWRETLRRTALRMPSAELEPRFTTAVTNERGVFALSARAGDRTALLLDVPLDDRPCPPLDVWTNIAEHLASGLRLRARDEGAPLNTEDATAVWHALLDGRLAITDRFDREGRRFVVVRATSADDRDALTERERRVLAAVAHGQANKQIALELGVSESTVSAALREAARKLGVRSRVELARILGAPRGG